MGSAISHTGVNPRKKTIDQIIPDEVLYQCDEQDVLSVASEYKCIIVECHTCPPDDKKYKANGKWTKPADEGLRFEVSRAENLSHTQCPDCLDRTLGMINSGETGCVV